MHPVRRRKKRPNYGVRTVEVARGKNGFGFTISGQQPCILSCIVGGSPAEKAGLRPGDYLVAVNGQSVSKLPHDDVVRLIGNLDGVLKLQIAENYYSDSSDEDNIATVRSKPKFIHKPRTANTSHHSNGCQTSKASKAVRDLRASTIYNKFALDGGSYPSNSALNNTWNLPDLPLRVSTTKSSPDRKEELSFVIGYLGTIEMPKQIQPGCRPQVVRGCIKRLRTEKRSHSWVLMRVHADGVTVAGNGGKILAEYPVNRITYCGASSEEDKKYFGLVTTATGDGNDVLPSSSCHVFAVQANLFEHEKHSAKAASLKVTCTSGTLSQGCFEFPSTSEPILNAIRSFCLTKDEGTPAGAPNDMVLANSPQPSHSGSTAASSNSDSGIGFRDECGNQSDRIVMVDVENQRLHIQQLYNSSKKLDNSLNIQLQATNSGSGVDADTDLQHAFARICPLPVSLDSVYGACSTDHHGRSVPKAKVPTSNRSRSPLLSSSPSSSDDENNKTLTKLAQMKNVTAKTKPGRSSVTKNYGSENSSKSLPPRGSWCEKSIFYQLGLLSNQSSLCGRPRRGHDLSYRTTSKSSENLDNSGYHGQENESEYGNIGFMTKLNSKSTDNLVQVDSYSKTYNKLSPQVSNMGKCTTGGTSYSPLSISYGEGSVLEQKTRIQEDVDFPDKTEEILLSYSSSPKRFFSHSSVSELGRSLGQTSSSFKSGKEISICSQKNNEPLLTYKLSPKVFGTKRPLVTQSLEDLKGSDPCRDMSEPSSEPSSRLPQWGSLQDLRSLDAESFEASLMPKDSGFDEKETSEETKGPVAWANSFEKLLEDPAGLSAFSEFLKKEFSQENITFWVSCEKYKCLEDESERKKVAGEIFETHLGARAMEPVNIDAQANQHAQEKLSEAPVDLFVPAQKQIFNLMKFDSYPRFIKSDLYKECLLTLDLANDNMEAMEKTVANETSPNGRGKLKKSRSDAEDSSRKSLLPWNKKNRSKSKDRGESEYKLSTLDPVGKGDNNEDVVSVRSEITSSRSSLASWDLALRGSFSRQSITSGEASERENCQLCRVILSDGATTVVRVRPKETIRELIHRLLEKRGLHYESFELFVTGSTKPLSLDEEASSVSNKEIRVEQRIVFRLDLPNRRTVSVKAKPSKTLGQVLRSVLHKYSYRLETVTICSMSENEVLELNLPVTAVDGRRLTVLTRSSETWKGENGVGSHVTSNKTFVKPGPTLEEITNKVFEEVLQGKSESGSGGKSDQGSLKSEEWGSEHSSGVFSKFLRRDSTYHEKSKGKSRGGTSRQIFEGATKHVEGVVSMVTGKPPLIGKWKSGGKFGGRSESEELYEGLKRAQRNRLEDQRGTEINIELPDFLKDKENAPASGKKSRIFRREDGATTPKFYDMEPPPPPPTTTIVESGQDAGTTPVSKTSSRTEKLSSAGVGKSSDPIKSDLSTASGPRKSDHSGRTISKPLTCKTYETPKTTPIKSALTADGSRKSGLFDESRVRTEPPPLPPKPKYLPSKSVPWNLNNLNSSRVPHEITNRGSNYPKPSDIKRDNKLARSRRTVYLDQPSSSFV